MPRRVLIGGSLLVLAIVGLASAQTRPGRGGAGVLLQATTPGATQIGNVNISGTSIAGTVTAGTPIAQSSGGTGAGALSCAAGAFLTSNGTAYSCGTAPAQFVLAASIGGAAPIIFAQTGSVTIGSLSKGTTGHYQLVIPGMTTSAIVVGSGAISGSPGMMFTYAPTANTLTVNMVNGANGPSDSDFSFIVVKL